MRSYLTRIGFLTAAGALLIALPMCAKDSGPPQSNPTFQGSGEAAARAALKSVPLGRVTSRDASGHARLVQSATDSALPALEVTSETAARIHLSRHASLFGLSEAAVRDASVVATHPIAGGASVVQFTQTVNGIDVFRSRASVVLDATKNLISVSSTLHPAGAAAHAVKAMRFAVTPEAALSKLYSDHFGVSLPLGAVSDLGPKAGGDVRSYAVPSAKGAPRILQATAKRVLFPEGKTLTPAYYVEFLARAPNSNDNEAYGYAVSASDGHVLHKTSLTAYETFKYRVWAEPGGDHIPFDGPFVDATPYKATPFPLAYRQPSDIDIDGLNHNPAGAADPWLTADKTVTFGNNVHAYSDRNDTHGVDDAGNTPGDGFDPGVDFEADLAPAGQRSFLRTYDTSQAPNASTDQIKAAVTQIFYDTNWLHDYWYDSGFNEAAGVAQLVNYGRGGKEGDPLLAQAQDGADQEPLGNNADMSTFSDGTSPRMQMYVWTGIPNRRVTTTPAISFTDGYGAAIFGPQAFNVPSTDAVVTTPADACTAVGANVAAKIAIIDRGTCEYTVKVKNAQDAGAVGVILVNNVAGPVPMLFGGEDASITIPMLALSLEDGQKLKPPAAVKATLSRAEVPIDGTIDNTVVAHEWGHYLHHRLVVCGSQSCDGMSEGWADFDALLMVLREGDILEGSAFPLAQYASAGFGPTSILNGIRRAPYSTDFAKFGYTFKHIAAGAVPPGGTGPGASMNEVHNVGEIWAEALFEGYVNLQKVGKDAGRSFQETKRRMANYIVTGMQATPVEPTFIEQRDAILAAVQAANQPADFQALAAGFAKRGFGAGAVAPPTSSVDLTEVKESMAVGGDFGLVNATLDDSGTSCDKDGILDSGESGVLKVSVRNTGFLPLAGPGTKVSVTSVDPNITVGPQAAIASIDVFGTATVSVPITAKNGIAARGQIPLSITLENQDAVTKTSVSPIAIPFNYDDVEKASVTEDAESTKEAWTSVGSVAKFQAWTRKLDTDAHPLSTNHVWHADDFGAASDESLVSPDLVVGTDDLLISFEHRFQFERNSVVDGGPDVYFDGGVLEVSSDGGTTWDDISKYSDPSYPQVIHDVAKNGNVLHGRKAWGGLSDGYPNFSLVSLNLGKQLSGKTIKLRFRVGTDEGSGAIGWDIDNLTIRGLTNTPFPAVVDDRGICTGQSGVDAGVDAGSQDTPPPSNSDDSCAVSPAVGHSTRNAWGLGLIGGLLMLLRRRRRTAR